MSAPDIARQLRHDDNGATALKVYIHISQGESNERVAAAFRSNVRSLKAVGE